MNCKILITGFIIIIATVGCDHQKKNDSSNLSPIVVDWNYKDLDYSHWVEDSTLIVPLETTDDCLIGEITYLVYQGHKIYIADNLSKAVYVFDEKGKLLSTLRKVGNGPEEYLDISAFTVHDSQLLIYDNMKRKIFFYQEDGDFLYEKDASKVWSMEMFCLGDDLYLLNDNGKTEMGYFCLFQLSPEKENNEIKTFLPFEYQNYIQWIIDRYSAPYGDEALFTVWPFDVLYEVKNGEVKAAYTVDFGDKRLPEEYIYGDGYTAIKVAQQDNYVMGINTVQQTDRYIFMTCSYNGTKTIIYDKETGKEFTAIRFYNKNLGGSAFMMSWTTMQNGYMVTYRNMADWVFEGQAGCDWDKEYFASEYTREMFKKFQKMNSEDNPVIIIQKIKENVELF